MSAARGKLDARLTLDRDGFSLDVALELPASGVTGVFGPSGSGKTTLLRCLAGLERGAAGTVRLADRVWQDSAAGIFVPPHRRGVGYVFQEASLFPHLDVAGNLRYAAKRASRPGPARDEVVAWLGLDGILAREPSSLSGGERQRVAVARALLAGPRLLLLDEPVSALDEPVRREVLPYLEAVTRRLEIPVLYVSHTLDEVTRLADRMVWMDGGAVRQVGPTAQVVAGMDFARWRGDDASVVVEARVAGHDDEYHLTSLETPWGPFRIRRQEREPGDVVRIQVLARDVSLSRAAERESSILNQLPVRVTAVEEGAPGAPGEVLVRLVPLRRDLGGHRQAPQEPQESPGPQEPPGPQESPGPREREGPDAAVLLARITRLSRDRLDVRPGRELHARVKSVALVE